MISEFSSITDSMSIGLENEEEVNCFPFLFENYQNMLLVVA